MSDPLHDWADTRQEWAERQLTEQETRHAELVQFYRARQAVTYTDGTPVQEGDRIRYHQAPGGLMAHGDWRYGVAVRLPVPHMGTWELVLRDSDNGRHYGLYGHVIEPVTSCRNCGEPIIEQSGKGYSVWSHPTHGMHTVCDWREGMAPTSRVATP